MNDPDEGSWQVFEHKEKIKHPDQPYLNTEKIARQTIDRQRFTCFTKSATEPLLWAHYAGGFSGIALGYELDEKKYDIRLVEYEGRACVTLEQLQKIAEGINPPQDFGILKTKAKCWIYEEEYRLFGSINDEHYLNNIIPKSIILGPYDSIHSDIIEDISRKYGIAISYLNKDEEDNYCIESL
ncbi:DUF2971 domain-containing protein [Chlorobaculum sp. 24CR]|uniref:DUF2971 domain-containing protein n=1 Tax=Chlorobaculum sp. 24CR TaxID=2508878 RepID=UPI00142F484F|nr:DUF2971 domain-containing protein [Chlorobaculum sp. 24CR]